MPTDFDQINFNSEYHSYTYNGKKLQSVTAFCKQFSKPFEREKWSAYVAKRDGVTQEEILEQWEAKGAASREKGTLVHDHIERVLLGEVDLTNKFTAMSQYIPEQEAFNALWLDGLWNEVEVLQTEWVVGDEELGLGGMVDALFMDKEDHTIHIFDWKTGEDFTTKSKYGEKMLNEFSALDKCKLNDYSLQTSLYRLIIERNTGFQVDGAHLVHLAPNGKYYIYEAHDYRELLERAIKRAAQEGDDGATDP